MTPGVSEMTDETRERKAQRKKMAGVAAEGHHCAVVAYQSYEKCVRETLNCVADILQKC